MIYVTGDTHGDLSRLFDNQMVAAGHKSLQTGDVVIVCGDFGLPFATKFIPKFNQMNEYFKNKGVMILYVDGNHENFDILKNYPPEEMFGGIVGNCGSAIKHLRRGEIYSIQGKTFFCFGGALSIDRSHGLLGVDYWHEELPTGREYEFGRQNLEKCNSIDFVITHECPATMYEYFKLVDNEYLYDGSDLPFFLDQIYSIAKDKGMKSWFFGHHHKEVRFRDFRGLYSNVVSID